ncbi:MAG: hypothetical protein IPJ19_19265 [Planctomycetes bacterium]|nr:hypothetical protein [Planctomycetota bacterium]
MAVRKKSGFRRRTLALCLGLVCSLAAAEVGLRVLLFWDTPKLEKLAHKLRQPGYYADMRRDSLYWKLQHIWTPRAQRHPFKKISEKTGWTGPLIDPQTLVQRDEAKIGDRRPVLLYGDSFAECVTPPEQTWQAFLERSPEGQTHALINFGTSGFGTDQTLMMLEATIGRFAGRNPLVIFSIFLDEDLDRTMLDFRGMPKPQFELSDGLLVFHPLEETDANVWWEKHPPGVPSYLWRLVRGPHGPLSESWSAALSPDASDAQVVALNRALLTRMHAKLEALHIEHFVLGFHGRMMLDNPVPHAWRERFVGKVCDELGVHFISSRPYLLSAVGRDSDLIGQSLFVTRGEGEGHYNARGNAVVLEAIRQGIHGRFGPADTSGVQAAMRRLGVHPDLEQLLELSVLGRPARLEYHGATSSLALREVETAKQRALALFPAREQAAELRWQIAQGTRFSAELRAIPGGEENRESQAVRFRLQIDGQDVRTLELAPGQEPVALAQTLAGPCTLTLRVEPVEGHPNSCWARLSAPVIE